MELKPVVRQAVEQLKELLKPLCDKSHEDCMDEYAFVLEQAIAELDNIEAAIDNSNIGEKLYGA